LIDSQPRHALATAGADYGPWDWDFKTDPIFFSRRCKEMLGYGEDGISDRPDE